ncbi:MAG TPA: hypothetical protein VEJ16_10215 [Alphaproteobacteria bacterium]|nr:hypothetical protein [Alphaproteobacteria bacterium]
MRKKENPSDTHERMPTDEEIAAAAERLSQTWRNPSPRAHSAGAGQIHQSLTRGRSHTVTYEIKRSPRKSGRTR